MVESPDTIVQVPSVKKNYVYNSVINLTNILFPLVSFAYVARVLGPTNFGRVNFASAIVTFFCFAACLGIPVYGTREIAKCRNDQVKINSLFSELFIFNLAASIISFLLYLVPILFIDRVHKESLLFLVFGLLIISNVFSVDWIFQGFENFKNIAIRSFIIKCCSLLLLVVFVKNESNYVTYALISIFSTVGATIAGFIYARKYARLSIKNISLGRHFKPIMIFFGSVAVTSIYINLDSTILGFLSTDKSVGLYAAAMRISRMLAFLVIGSATVLMPRVSYYIQNNMVTEAKEVINKSIRFVFFVSLPITSILVFLAPKLLFIVAGNKFHEAIFTLKILSFLPIILGLSNLVVMQLIIPLNKEKFVFWAAIIAALLSVGSNFILIPIWNHNGAAISNVIAELGILLVLCLLIRKNACLQQVKFLKDISPYLFAAISVSPAFWFINSYVDSIFLVIILSILALMLYFVVLLVFKDSIAGMVFNELSKVGWLFKKNIESVK